MGIFRTYAEPDLRGWDEQGHFTTCECGAMARVFVFTTAERITYCPTCQAETGHEVLDGRLFQPIRGERHEWSSVLRGEGLSVIDQDAIRSVTVSSWPLRRKVLVYNEGFSYAASVGVGYWFKSRDSRKRNIGCAHLNLDDITGTREDGTGLLLFKCPDCGEGPNPNKWLSSYAIQIIRSNRQLWRDRRHTKVPWDGDEYQGAKKTFVRLSDTRRGLIEVSNAPAREIEERRINAAWKYVLSSPDFYEYRAPYLKVKELRDAGLDVDRIARKLKVSPRTIDNRLVDIPDTLPTVNRNALQMMGSGHYETKNGTRVLRQFREAAWQKRD